jgi:hypothetical protein
MAKAAIKTMQQMEQENRRLLQEEADKKVLARQQTEEIERQKSLQGESERTRDEQESSQKRLAEQEQRDKDALNLADHQRHIDAAADLQQREHMASISGTPLPQQQQRATELELRPVPVLAKDQGEYHVRNSTGDGSLGAFVVRGSGDLDHASKQEFLKQQAAEQEQQKQADNELEY